MVLIEYVGCAECDTSKTTILTTILRTVAIFLVLELDMAAIPPMTFSAQKIRESREHQLAKVSNMQEGPFKFYPRKDMEYNPLKYNSKLMDSIWGIYNRYSPHNFKKNNVEIMSSVGDLQQTAAVSQKTDLKAATPVPQFENLWNAVITMPH